jgi:hypothetical protein
MNSVAGSQHVAAVGDIGERYGVSKQMAEYWTKKPGFPKPYDHLRQGQVWRWKDVTRWAEKNDIRPKGDGERESNTDSG